MADFGVTHGATSADFNGDGYDDALLIRHYSAFPRYLINQDGSFLDQTDLAFPGNKKRDYHSCPAADVDGDRDLDIYCTVGGKGGGTAPNPNELWLAASNGTFTLTELAWGARNSFGRGREATFIDANGDGRPDLYIGNQYPRLDGHPGPNRLFLNVNGKRFRKASEFGVDELIGGDALQSIDYDLDGDEDLLVCGQGQLRLYRNVRNTGFRDITEATGARPQTPCLDAGFVQVNPDGRPDLVVLGGGRSRSGNRRASTVFLMPLYSAASFRRPCAWHLET